jgi:hypothetical protein
LAAVCFGGGRGTIGNGCFYEHPLIFLGNWLDCFVLLHTISVFKFQLLDEQLDNLEFPIKVHPVNPGLNGYQGLRWWA